MPHVHKSLNAMSHMHQKPKPVYDSGLCRTVPYRSPRTTGTARMPTFCGGLLRFGLRLHWSYNTSDIDMHLAHVIEKQG